MKIRALTFLAAATVASVFFINLCGTIFQCGCESLWGAAATHCNIHAAHGRHCPWCAVSVYWQAAIFGTILAAQGLVAFGPWVKSPWIRLAGAVAAFPATGLGLALLFGWFTQYWAH
ncbi:MAG: hypothetical protein J0L64_21625 [Acidobacteria bacterium]|nr:hypothetical protein [Acidobacteriota bacterium]